MKTNFIRKLFILSLFLFVVCATGRFAFAQERIISFDSQVQVKEDSTLIVTEMIKVHAEGRNIKRGIYRDFPTRYKDRFGNDYVVGFDVIEILRDGIEESYHMQNISNGKRIYIGNKDIFLKTDDYTYTIVYETTRQLGFFKDHDEIYWNVTGNGWDFPIEKATATVILPESAKSEVIDFKCYTGLQGSRESACITDKNLYIEPVFDTTRTLNSREGLTIFVSWPKGFVTAPTSLMKLKYFLSDNKDILVALLMLLALGVFFYLAWDNVGRDPKRGIIVPLFHPPEKMSPAAMRFLLNMGYDNKIFTAAVLNMAVKGYIKIEEKDSGLLGGKTYVLKRDDEDKLKLLSSEEQNAAKLLLISKTAGLELVNTNHQVIKSSINSLQKGLEKQLEQVYFHSNKGVLGIGLLIYLAFSACAVFMFRGGFFGILSGLIIWVGGMILCGVFGHLLKAPTLQGRKIMDQIEGFKMFLSVTEKERMNLLNPPDQTPELFEKYLPYALALGVEQKWSEQFATVFERLAQAGSAYHPYWYHGRYRDFRANDFSRNLSSSFSNAIASSSTPPGSSSGGGGFSGGGGGGGGGGGW
ncbi:MAG: DUF2207 domain-containing protein [Candidatus Omnitrophica bacterium]|nr:DUF2207 domain-containing protein [Candidatus Omnitrophota bacterium]MBU1996960.1 DUF2207 domain-containing protein [Candidatus Omnitrophota bacterium]MBU4333904.1 DUF2207 domain-containing protein [Candidatus Omnitrophota bacterium]